MSQYTVLCHTIRSGLLVAAGEAVSYRSWSDEFSRTNLDDKVKSLQLHIMCENLGLPAKEKTSNLRFEDKERFIAENSHLLLRAPIGLNEDQLKRLDFRRWDEPREGLELFLIPLYLAPFIAPNEVVYSISGNRKTFAEADKDHRQGMLAFGWMIEAGKAFPEKDVKG